eukprot:791094-Prymnesium_polylepis.1
MAARLSFRHAWQILLAVPLPYAAVPSLLQMGAQLPSRVRAMEGPCTYPEVAWWWRTAAQSCTRTLRFLVAPFT